MKQVLIAIRSRIITADGLKIGHNCRKSMPACNNNSQDLELFMVRISFVLDSSFVYSLCVARALLVRCLCIFRGLIITVAIQKINKIYTDSKHK